MIPLNQVLYYEMEYEELDTLIQREFGKPSYSCIENGEWDNNSAHTFEIVPDDISEFGQKELATFLEEENYPYIGVHTLLCELATRKIIPYGNYLINVWW